MNNKWLKFALAVVLVAVASLLGNEDIISQGWAYVIDAVGLLFAGIGVKQK